LSDPALLDVVLVNDSLKMLGTTPGIANLTVTTGDNYGGTDTMKLTAFYFAY